MPILDEVPGALERPSGSRIQIYQSDDGRETTISIPPFPRRPILIGGTVFLSVNLLLILYIGAMLLLDHRSVLLMTEIAPGGLSPPLRRYEPWLILAWLFMLGVGLLLLWALTRPMLTRETLTVGPKGVRHERRGLGRKDGWAADRHDVRGFRLVRDPHGLSPGVLTIQSRGEERVVAEYTYEAEREWLASVGNALLRHW